MAAIEVEIHGGIRVLVDEEDAHWLEGRRWVLRKQGVVWVEGTYAGYMRQWRLGRLIMGAKEGEAVYLVNGIKTDLRKENLFIAPSGHVPPDRRRRSSQYTGVSRCGNKWRAAIRVGGVLRHIGVYRTELEAAVAYNEAALAAFGLRARLNDTPLIPAHYTKRGQDALPRQDRDRALLENQAETHSEVGEGAPGTS